MTATKPSYVLTVELDLTLKELEDFRKLAQLRNESVEAVVRDCMNTKCQEQLQKHANAT